jgi:hypothetical protein
MRISAEEFKARFGLCVCRYRHDKRDQEGEKQSHRQVLDIIGKQDLYKDGVVRYGQASGINKGLVLLEEWVAA